MIKVLHVYRTYFPDTQGGLEEVIRQICLNTRSLDIESRVFTLSRYAEPMEVSVDGTRVIRVPQAFEIASNGFCFAGIREFARQVEWADIVHYHFPWPWGDVMHLLAARGKRTVVTYHSDIVRQRMLEQLYRPLMFRFLESATRIVATSPNYFATSEILGRFSEQVEVIPIGVNEDSYPVVDDTSPVTATMRDRYGEDFFLFVGVLRYYKGLHILLDAVKDADYKVLIVGSGPVEAELREQVKERHIDNVVFSGYVTDEEKMALFQLCRGVVFPSYLRAEAFGVTLLEGALSRKPLISAEIGSGTTHVNIDGETGIVIPPGCPSALREAMDRLYFNPAWAAALGQNARRRYEKNFTGTMMGQRYAATYREVSQEPYGAFSPTQAVGS